MEESTKEAIIFKKFDRQGNERIIPLYIINESLAKDFKNIVKRKEEYQNTWFINKVLPKDLFQIVESKLLPNKNPMEKYQYEKELQFKIHKYDFEPYSLAKHMNTLKVI